MKKRVCLGLLIVMMIVSLSTPAFAADLIYRLTHNDQNVLAISEVVEVEDDFVKFKVEDTVVSEDDLDKSNKKEQYKPDDVVLSKEDLGKFTYMVGKVKYEVGDKYLLSLDKTSDGYEVAWGVFRIDSLDKENLNVLYLDGASEGEKMDSVMLKLFVNSDGVENEFSIDEGKILSGDRVVYEDGKMIKAEDYVEKKEPLESRDYIKYGILIVMLLVIVVAFVKSKVKKK